MSAQVPWWASDPEGTHLDEEDPFRAHQSARWRQQSSQPEWAQALGDVAVSVVRRLSTVPEAASELDGHLHGVAEDPACRNCPICTLLRAIESSGPEVSRHLGDAARHLALAAASFLEALAEGSPSEEVRSHPGSGEAHAPRPVSRHDDRAADAEDRS